jgi:hypothetical protein
LTFASETNKFQSKLSRGCIAFTPSATKRGKAHAEQFQSFAQPTYARLLDLPHCGKVKNFFALWLRLLCFR